MDILNIFLVFLNFYTYFYISYKLLNYKFTNTKNNICFIIITSLIYSILLKFKIIYFFKIILTFSCLTLFLRKNINTNFYLIIQTCFFTIITGIFSEQVVAIIFTKILNISIYSINDSKKLFLICNISIIIVQLFIINLKTIFNKFSKTFNKINIDSYTIYNIFIIILMTIISFSYSSICIYFYKYLHNTAFLVIIVLCIIYIYIFLTFLYTKQLAYKNFKMSKITQKKYIQLEIYSKSIENLIDDISAFKHDYNNIIFMMNGFLENNDFKNLKCYFHNNVFKQNDYYDISKLKKIKNSGIKGVLAAKISQMIKSDITVNIEIFNSIEHIYINELDLCRILGIFLDNALESAKISSQKLVSISLVQDNGLNITVLNDFKHIKNINSIFKKGYSSKGNNRGTGLYTVRSILNEKYPNDTILNTYIENNMFIQDLYIKAK